MRRTAGTDLYWVGGPWSGKLALAARPRAGEWLHDELANWRREGVDMVFSFAVMPTSPVCIPEIFRGFSTFIRIDCEACEWHDLTEHPSVAARHAATVRNDHSR
jgi:hypothetical protein